MRLFLKHIIFVSLVFRSVLSMGQDESEWPTLLLMDSGKEIENRIQISISNNEYGKLKRISGEKQRIKNPVLLVNEESVEVDEIRTRGKTTLHFRRKSLNFSLANKVTFFKSGKTFSMKKFYALSLSMDRFYFRNRMSFEIMHEIGLFGLFYTYAEIVINGNSEGIYLVVERPQDFALKEKNSPLAIRRGYNQKIEKLKTGKKTDKAETKKYKNYYTNIYKAIKHHNGEELYNELSQWIDLEMYMKWLAFNYFIRNGDYTDEVYFCISPVEDRFKIIPWDYDDIFAVGPHEGKQAKNKIIGGKYIFSSEDLLDRKIARDSYLYELYLKELKQMLIEITPELLHKVISNSYSDLFPYYNNPEIIGMVKHDTYKNADLENLNASLVNIYKQLLTTRFTYLNTLD